MDAVKQPKRLIPPSEMEGWKVVSAKGLEITPRKIFDYMNGAGEMYLAYKFDRLSVWTYQRAEETSITVEAYKMGTPEEACGVLTQDLEGNEVKIGQQSVYGGGLLQFWQGRWFVRIIAEYETPETRRAVLGLGRAFAGQIPREGERPRILKRLPAKGCVPKSTRYFHKQVCLNAFYFFATENLLELSEKTEVAMADYRLDRRSAALLLIRYPSAKSAAKAHARFRKVYMKGLTISPGPIEVARMEDEEYVGLRLEGEYLVVVFKTRSRVFCTRLLEAANLKRGGKKQ